MRGKVDEIHEYSYVVLNWLKRRGIEKKHGESDVPRDRNKRE